MFAQFLHNALARPSRLALFASLTLALAGCGGGGGSPGAVGGGTTPTNPTKAPASVVLTSSADTINASGADGTEVTLTAVVKDAGNNAISGATVNFSSTSGTISSGARITDANGSVTEKLSVKGDSTPREITITASSGGVNSTAKKISVVATTASAPKIVLTAGTGNLASAGSANSALAIRALVLDANNVVVANAPVTFTTDSGALSASKSTSDANGIATVNLNTGTDPATRSITVTATAPGAAATAVKVSVTGTTLTLNASPTVTAGASTSLTAVLTDSSGNPLPNRPVTFSATRNPITTASNQPSPTVTDSSGKVVLNYKGNVDGVDIITVSSTGETTSTTITTVSTSFSVAAVNASNAVQTSANTETCQAVLVRDFNGDQPRAGTVTVSTSRGAVYSDSNCSFPLASAVSLSIGRATVYVKASSPGIATLTANSSATGSSVQGTVEFVSPLVASAVISVQTSPAVIGANIAGSTSEQSVLRAVVLDKATLGNPVKNARVAFSIVSDASGGTLSQPSEVLTASDGSATVTYIAGATATATDGVVIEARIVSGVSSAAATTKLTVAKRSLFITAGTGNSIEAPSTSTYRKEYTVFVTDAAGNPVNDVAITASVRPRHYRKGYRVFDTASGAWRAIVTAECNNEDLDSNGVLGAGEDINLNGRLDPGTPLNITSTARTGANGTAVVSLTYPKDRVGWIDVDFTIRGQVSGSEASYVGYTELPGSAEDFATKNSPPGQTSPYGTASSCTDSN